MTATGTMYWLRRSDSQSASLVHKSDCRHCPLDDNAEPKPELSTITGTMVRENWWRPYATLGAAIDAGLSAGEPVHECGVRCAGPRHVNPAS